MAAITASMVAELRAKTDAPMMECKKALTEAGGDLAKAEELLRIKSGAKASKAAGRIAAEGVIGLYVAYVIPVYLRLRDKDFRVGPWNLGRWSKPIGWTAVVWVGIIWVTSEKAASLRSTPFISL